VVVGTTCVAAKLAALEITIETIAILIQYFDAILRISLLAVGGRTCLIRHALRGRKATFLGLANLSEAST
jgi:hypothetical protein